ncbi:MAG: lysophospholipase [Pegethrix bostrychoides GSE-TBD4-15B]|uniref:Lysophospholipase n=1 Tax=Pegethrix bostrychoides GSE-TBD4-15B TaxID=2839662 RepID=A0A951PDY1_9CYAN|nr:lysophospholipase [Pegethrix bostrychoides GSE-TBD4-15B]
MWSRLKQLPTWVILSLSANGILLVLLLGSLTRSTQQVSSQQIAPSVPAGSTAVVAAPPASTPWGERQKLTYEQWLDLLQQEAAATAARSPVHLSILAGDSISLWFPNELLPSQRHWLNQGISGETSAGLLRRLNLFDQTQPQTIFVMIGINDLLNGISDQTLLDNQQLILQALQAAHPQAQIVLQSILPHAEVSSWEGRSRLQAISNQRIQALNAQLEEMARQAGAYFLDLYPLFATPEGYLRPELSTDGLHLSPQGYQTWSIALQVYSREVLNSADSNMADSNMANSNMANSADSP